MNHETLLEKMLYNFNHFTYTYKYIIDDTYLQCNNFSKKSKLKLLSTTTVLVYDFVRCAQIYLGLGNPMFKVFPLITMGC